MQGGLSGWKNGLCSGIRLSMVALLLGLSPALVQGQQQGGAVSAGASGLAWPTERVRMVVGFAPGGIADTVSRLVAQKMAERLAQPVLVENRGGAGGLVGLELTAKSLSDGYPIMIMFGAFGDARGQRTFRNAGDVGAELARDR